MNVYIRQQICGFCTEDTLWQKKSLTDNQAMEVGRSDYQVFLCISSGITEDHMMNPA